jgi:hypothetical protein
MPLTVFAIKGVPGARSERIEVAVVAGGKHATGPHEAWIAADPFNGGFRVLITGPHGFEHTVTLAIDDDRAVILERGDTATVEPGRAAKSEDPAFALIETPAVAKFRQRAWRKNVGR